MTALSNATCIKINHSKLTTDLAGGSWRNRFGGQREEGIGALQRALVAACPRAGTGGEHGHGGDGGDADTAGVLPPGALLRARERAYPTEVASVTRGARRSVSKRCKQGQGAARFWHRPQEMPGALPSSQRSSR